ncbi:MAG: glutathionylspermidine synthase family protein [Clostridiales bacterium]|jgi:glutathionylspermidine synthase|nr:glutathionylspermidine synthase family protein [Clostridiales bacterium]
MDVIFDGYKWDMQSGEQSTICNQVLLMERCEALFLSEHAEKLFHETIAMERVLHKSPQLAVRLGISQQMTDALCNCKYDAEKHIRFMRFDFHPTTDGWRISEVNSDVPAGWPEASVLPALAEKYFDGFKQYGCFGDALKKKLLRLIPEGSTIAYLHDTHTVEDYQILKYMGNLLEKYGYSSVYASPEHIKWDENKAVGIGGIVRYFPVEWMEFSPADWKSFVNSETPSCNHPIALLTQSKRLPLVWDELGVEIPAWRKLLPETKCITALPSRGGRILKPAFGRVGEGINICVTKQEEKEIYAAAKNEPTQWVAQKMFESKPIDGLHINVGVFVIDGEFAGFYARVSKNPKIDEDASEIPILVR